MDTDFIKWMCEKAGNRFGYEEESECITYIDEIGTSFTGAKYKDSMMYSLLLQRATEGCMIQFTEIDVYWLASWGWSYDIKMYEDDTLYNHESYYETSDQAKESAIRYIYDQDSKNHNQ